MELVRSKTQNVTIIDQEKHKIKQIYIWIPQKIRGVEILRDLEILSKCS